MGRTIQRVNFTAIQQASKQKRVAAYARVSNGKETMLHSLSAQVSYYSSLIQKTPGWDYAGVYADEAISGTKNTRGEFQRMLADCRAGKIDMIFTKSISRFARNTVTTLQAIRELRLIGVDVYFEEQNIHTLGEEGEFILTLLAAYAEEEARSASENQRWRIQKQFQQGRPTSIDMFGFRFENGRLDVFSTPPEGESYAQYRRKQHFCAGPLKCIWMGLRRMIWRLCSGKPGLLAGMGQPFPVMAFWHFCATRRLLGICFCRKHTA